MKIKERVSLERAKRSLVGPVWNKLVSVMLVVRGRLGRLVFLLVRAVSVRDPT